MDSLMMMVSPGRYVHGAGALKKIGNFVKPFGDHALLIADEIVLSLVEASVRESLGIEKIKLSVSRFNGECSYQEISRLKGEAESASANLIIGVGGGKALDAAKAVAHHLKCPLTIVPTIAATDAPTSSIAIIYREDHTHEGVLRLGKNPDLILVDTEMVAQAPARFLVSGMGDALGTRFEAEACFQSAGNNMVGYRSTLAALTLAKSCYEILIQFGLRAKWSVERKLVTPSLEKVVEANILLSGLGFESGGLAAAHAIHTGFTHTIQSTKTYHGEKVAFGTLAQLFMEDRPEEEIVEVGQFCLSVGLPVCLADLFVEDTEIPVVAEAACRSAIMKNMPFPVLPQLVRDAIRLADSSSGSTSRGVRAKGQRMGKKCHLREVVKGGKNGLRTQRNSCPHHWGGPWHWKS